MRAGIDVSDSTPATAARRTCCCRGLIGNTNYMCLARGLDLDPPHCGDECPERPACIEANNRAASIPYEGTDCTPEEAVEAVKAVRATAAGCGQHQPPKPGVIKMGLPHEEVLPATAAALARRSPFTEADWQDALDALGARADDLLPTVEKIVANGPWQPLSAAQTLVEFVEATQ